MQCNAWIKSVWWKRERFFLSVFVTVSANWPWQADQRLHLTNGKQTTNISVMPTDNFVSCSWIELHHDLSKTIRTICQKLLGPCCTPVACRQQTPAWSCFNGKNNQFTKYCLRPPLSHLSSNIPEHRNYLEWFGQTKGEFQLLSLDVDIF